MPTDIGSLGPTRPQIFRGLPQLAPFTETTSMDRVERVARAMCRADGVDPDHLIRAASRTESSIEQGQQRNWTDYERQARLFLAGLDAVKE